ncbi:MAG: hypothetical protein JWN36_2060 [Microbacteriaceae bacterium]|nr:hypothetical protein [Microbacteriaceae bacterium]
MTETVTPTRRVRSRVGTFLVAWLVLSLMAAVWSIATPPGGAPDEAAHAVKAASVVRGELSGAPSVHGTVVRVPAYVAYVYDQTCYAFHPTVTAACGAAPISGDPDRIVTTATTAGLYNPIYYALVGWPTLLAHDETGVYLMRIVSGILSSLFLAAAVAMIATWRRRMIPLLGIAIASTPMVFFLNASINPNSLEVTATLAAFVGVLSIVHRPDRSLLVERAVIVTVSAALAVNTRGLSPLWVAIAVLVPFALVGWARIRELLRQRAVIVAIVVIAAATVAALLWTTFSNSLGSAITDPEHPASGVGVGASPIAGFVQIFVGTFDYGQGLVGQFGWLDTPAPTPVFFVWAAFIGMLVVASLVVLRGRAFVVAVGFILGLLVLPPLIQAAYIHGGGIIWQGRYALPLFVCAMVALATLLDDRMPALSPRSARTLVAVVLGSWLLSQVLAFAYALKRYGVGAVGTSWKKLLIDPDWAPPGGVPVNLAAAVVIFAAGAVLLALLCLSVAREGGSASIDEPAPDLREHDDDTTGAKVVNDQSGVVPEAGALTPHGA